MSQGINRKLLISLRKVVEQKENFPIGILAYFGPSDQQITKAVAIVIPNKTASPLYKSWTTPAIKTDSRVATEIGQYFLENNVKEVVMTDGVVGCPHDEGIDFPMGEQCPYCPFWADYQD